MARTFYRVHYTMSFSELQANLEGLLESKGYFRYSYKNVENVWKKGTGLATSMHFIKIEYDTDNVMIWGWTAAGIGSASMNELGLNGFVGALPKKMIKSTIEEMIQTIY